MGTRRLYRSICEFLTSCMFFSSADEFIHLQYCCRLLPRSPRTSACAYVSPTRPHQPVLSSYPLAAMLVAARLLSVSPKSSMLLRRARTAATRNDPRLQHPKPPSCTSAQTHLGIHSPNPSALSPDTDAHHHLHPRPISSAPPAPSAAPACACTSPSNIHTRCRLLSPMPGAAHRRPCPPPLISANTLRRLSAPTTAVASTHLRSQPPTLRPSPTRSCRRLAPHPSSMYFSFLYLSRGIRLTSQRRATSFGL